MLSHVVVNALVFGMSGMPLAARSSLSFFIHVCHAAIHVTFPSSGNTVLFTFVPARRGSWFAPLPPHSP